VNQFPGLQGLVVGGILKVRSRRKGSKFGVVAVGVTRWEEGVVAVLLEVEYIEGTRPSGEEGRDRPFCFVGVSNAPTQWSPGARYFARRKGDWLIIWIHSNYARNQGRAEAWGEEGKKEGITLFGGPSDREGMA